MLAQIHRNTVSFQNNGINLCRLTRQIFHMNDLKLHIASILPLAKITYNSDISKLYAQVSSWPRCQKNAIPWRIISSMRPYRPEGSK